MNNTHSVLLVLVIAIVTIALRFLPFIIFSNKNKTPKLITYLGNVLPFAIMGMLVIYCLRNISFVYSPFGLPEIISCVLVVILHAWRGNTLLSILSGTVVYMILVQLIF